MRHLQVASNLWNHKLWLITHLRTEWTKWLLLRLARAGTLNAAEGPRFGSRCSTIADPTQRTLPPTESGPPSRTRDQK
jgi:hypothetical protein